MATNPKRLRALVLRKQAVGSAIIDPAPADLADAVLDWDEVERHPEILEVTLIERQRLVSERRARSRYESLQDDVPIEQLYPEARTARL